MEFKQLRPLFDLVLRHYRVGEHPCPSVRGGKRQGEALGDGISAWLALAERYDSYVKETRRSCYEDLTINKMRHGEDPEDFFKMEELRVRLKEMGEVI